MNPVFSIILPVYNQENHLEIIRENYVHELEKAEYSWEILLIVNGSKDQSFAKAQQIALTDPRFKAFNLEQGGWGRAVKFGIEKAQGQYICYTNSARTHPAELVKILRYALVTTDTVVKANRIIRQGFLRRLGSVLYNFENRLFFRFPIWDVNGTPKVFPAHLLKNMTIYSDNDLIDAEIMARCEKLDIPVIEVPVKMNERISGNSTTGLVSAWQMYTGLFKLKRRLK